MKRERRARWPRLASLYLLALATVALVGVASGQQEQEEGERRVRVPKLYTNVHMGPNTTRPVLVLAPKDTVFRVVGTRGEWLEVELSPELREKGMVMRWYENEERGWVHENQVEPVE